MANDDAAVCGPARPEDSAKKADAKANADVAADDTKTSEQIAAEEKKNAQKHRGRGVVHGKTRFTEAEEAANQKGAAKPDTGGNKYEEQASVESGPKGASDILAGFQDRWRKKLTTKTEAAADRGGIEKGNVDATYLGGKSNDSSAESYERKEPGGKWQDKREALAKRNDGSAKSYEAEEPAANKHERSAKAREEKALAAEIGKGDLVDAVYPGKKTPFEARVVSVRKGMATLKWTYDDDVPPSEVAVSDCTLKTGPSIYDECAKKSNNSGGKSYDKALSSGNGGTSWEKDGGKDKQRNTHDQKQSSSSNTCWGLGEQQPKDSRQRQRERSRSKDVVQSVLQKIRGQIAEPMPKASQKNQSRADQSVNNRDARKVSRDRAGSRDRECSASEEPARRKQRRIAGNVLDKLRADIAPRGGQAQGRERGDRGAPNRDRDRGNDQRDDRSRSPQQNRRGGRR